MATIDIMADYRNQRATTFTEAERFACFEDLFGSLLDFWISTPCGYFTRNERFSSSSPATRTLASATDLHNKSITPPTGIPRMNSQSFKATGCFPPLRYCYAVALVAVALAVTLLILPLQEQSGSLLFVAAVTLASWHGGLGPGIVATLASAFALNCIPLPYTYSAGQGAADAARTGVFILLAVLISSLQSRWRRSERRLVVGMAEQEIARKIQHQLFPQAMPELPGFDIAAVCVPANATGGDYYDCFAMPEGRVGIAVGDVSGHGFGPALLMAELHAYLQALALSHDDAGAMLTQANEILFGDTREEQFVTVFLACLDPVTRSFTYASAGQEAYLFQGERQVIRLESTGLPLGLIREQVIHRAPPVQLVAGQILLMVTDGVYEAKSADGASFGLPGVLDLVRANSDRNAGQIVDTLCKAAKSHLGRLPQVDDITVLVIKSV